MKKNSNNQNSNITKALHTQTPQTHIGEQTTPIFLTSGYKFDNAQQMQECFIGENNCHAYSRYQNPNTDEFIDRLAKLENLPCGIATASGMAALSLSILSLCKSGDHVISSHSLFGSTYMLLDSLLPKWNINTTFVSLIDIDAFKNAITKTTKAIVIETPANPSMEIADLSALATLAHKHGIALIVDNCMTSPIIQTPADFGADVIVHSATKIIDGQGRTIGGALLCREEFFEENMRLLRLLGPTLSAFNAWILSKSLETLEIRVNHQSNTAAQLVERLPALGVKPYYPFLATHPQFELAKKQMKNGGYIFTFDIGNLTKAQKLLNSVKLASMVANFGDTRTIISHPATTTHAKLTPVQKQLCGVTEGLVRMSIGLENIEDIYQDLTQAMLEL